MVSFYQLNSKSNGLVLLLKTRSYSTETVSCHLLPRTDGKDGNVLKLKKIGPIFSSFDAMSSKVTKIVIVVSSP